MLTKRYGGIVIAALFVLGVVGTADAARLNRHVRIHNDTSTVMTEFYASNVDASDYEEDILGDSVLKPGRIIDINIDDGTGYCKYDLLAKFADGGSAKKNRVNVCTVSDFHFND